MSDTKKLNEGVVTALADTDLVLAADANGKLRPISVADLLAAVRGSIKVGGRNLLQGSMESMAAQSQSGYSFADGVHSIIMKKGSTGMMKRAGTFPLGQYAISVEMRADVPMTVRWYLANNESSGKNWDIDTEWRRYEAVLTPTSGDLQFRIVSANNYTDRFYARFPKIEEGNIPTGFSLAPEDVLAKSGG